LTATPATRRTLRSDRPRSCARPHRRHAPSGYADEVVVAHDRDFAARRLAQHRRRQLPDQDRLHGRAAHAFDEAVAECPLQRDHRRADLLQRSAARPAVAVRSPMESSVWSRIVTSLPDGIRELTEPEDP
jgi:hypothetical protein